MGGFHRFNLVVAAHHVQSIVCTHEIFLRYLGGKYTEITEAASYSFIEGFLGRMHLQIGDAGVIWTYYMRNIWRNARETSFQKITKQTPNHSIAKQLLLRISDVNNYFQEFNMLESITKNTLEYVRAPVEPL